MAEGEGKAAVEAEPPRTTGQRFIDLGFQALPAIGGAIGFVGFVAVAGAAIQWVRFSAAGLPADQAVSVIPRPELVTIGASFLIVYTLLGLLAVLLTYMLDSRGTLSEATRWGLVLVAAVEIGVAFAIVDLSTEAYVAAAAWILVLVALSVATLARAAIRVNSLRARREQRDNLRRLAEKAVAASAAAAEARSSADGLRGSVGRGDTAADALFARYETTAVTAENRAASAREAFESAMQAASAATIVGPLAATRRTSPGDDYTAEDALEILEERRQAVPVDSLGTLVAPIAARFRSMVADRRFVPTMGVLIGGAAAIALLAVLGPGGYWLIATWLTVIALSLATLSAPTALAAVFAAGVATLCDSSETAWLIPVVGVAAVLGLVNLGFAAATKRFAWYAVGVFLSVPLFGAILTAARTVETAKVQPVALVRKGDEVGTCGIYVTETDKRVYLARVETDPERPDEPKDGSGSIFWVPTADVDVVEVGTLLTLEYADRRARQLLAEAYDDRAAEKPTAASVQTTVTQQETVTVTKKAQPPVRPVRRREPDVDEREFCAGGRAVPAEPAPGS